MVFQTLHIGLTDLYTGTVYNRKVPLTEMQQQAVAVLDWLLEDDDGRQTGRTMAIAVALIRKAMRYPGTTVHFFDHHRMTERLSRLSRVVVGPMIQYLIVNDPSLRQSWFELREGSLRLRDVIGYVPPDWVSWLPAESVLESTRSDLQPRPMGEILAFERELDDLVSVATGDRPFVQTAAGTGNLGPPPKQPRSRYERMLDED